MGDGGINIINRDRAMRTVDAHTCKSFRMLES